MSEITRGVICMPLNLAMATSLSRAQFHGRAQALLADFERLKGENEALRREREGKVLCDLDLFETLRDSANTEADEHRQCMATYRPLRQENLDAVVKKCDDLLAVASKEASHD